MGRNYVEQKPTMTMTREPQAQPPRVNWWLRLTSSGWDQPLVTVQQREMARRSRLTSWIVLSLLVMEVLLLLAGISVPSTLVAVAIAGAGTIVAAVLNRAGFVSVAGGLLVLLLSGAVIGSVASAQGIVCAPGAHCSPFVTSGGNGQISLVYLPAFDLLAISVIVGASILPRASAFVIAAMNVALICLDFYLQPHAADVSAWVAYEGAIPLIIRPIALQIIIAAVAYLWVRGTDQAILRADRAEELAAMEHAIAEQKQQLDVGIQQILQTHIRAANGDFSARAPLGQENILWQVAASLNNLLSRLQRAGNAEHQLRRTEEEARRLAAALDDVQSGRRPLWPAASGTPVDMLIERLARGARPAAPPSFFPDQQRQPGVGMGAGMHTGMNLGQRPGATTPGTMGGGMPGGMGNSMLGGMGRGLGTPPPVSPSFNSGPLLPPTAYGAPPAPMHQPLPSISQFPPAPVGGAPSEPQHRRGPAQPDPNPNPNPWAFPLDPRE